MLSPFNSIDKGNVFCGCPSAAFVCPFIETDIATTISHESLEQFW